jgi:ferredoxin
MKVIRKIIEIDEELCDGCGNCVPSCAEGALVVEDGKARVVKDQFCDGLGACLGECPTGALKLIEREAEEFDEEAVEEYLSDKEKERRPKEVIHTGCPSAAIRSFSQSETDRAPASPEKTRSDSASELTHWPVQIMLVPENAPFLKGADLLVVADCAPLAYPDFHRDFLKGKAVMMGCPKFDDAEAYIDKFARIFRSAGVKSITAVIMEVPCCSALPVIVRKGLEKAGRQIPMEEVTLSPRGRILERKKVA